MPDSPRTGVDRPDLDDPNINRSYAELAGHYRVLVDPAGPQSHATRPAWSGRCRMCATRLADREFASVEQMQQAALDWCVHVAGRRSCRRLR